MTDKKEICEDGQPDDVPGEIGILTEECKTFNKTVPKRKKRKVKWYLWLRKGVTRSLTQFSQFESFSSNENLERIVSDLCDVDELS